MKKLAIFAVAAVLFTNNAYACENPTQANVKVNGLVCDFCARALEKVFGKQEAVDHIKVDLDKGVVDVFFKTGKKLNDDTITKLITDSGYNVTAIDKQCK